MNMKALLSLKTSVAVYQLTQRNIQEGGGVSEVAAWLVVVRRFVHLAGGNCNVCRNVWKILFLYTQSQKPIQNADT